MLDFLNLLGRHPERVKADVEIYTLQTCPFCMRAKLLLWWKGVNYTEYKIDADEEARSRMAQQRANGRRSVPQILLMVSKGGCDDLYRLEQGQLDSQLAKTAG